jgi:hypothetical protein
MGYRGTFLNETIDFFWGGGKLHMYIDWPSFFSNQHNHNANQAIETTALQLIHLNS